VLPNRRRRNQLRGMAVPAMTGHQAGSDSPQPANPGFRELHEFAKRLRPYDPRIPVF